MRRMTAVCYCAVTALALWGQARGAEPTFRQVLHRYLGHRKDVSEQKLQPPSGYPTDASHSIALEYAVELRHGGSDEAVDPEQHQFVPGDQIRVRIEPFDDLYVYVFFEDEEGRRQCLLPRDKSLPRLVKHDQPIELPTDGTVFEFERGCKGETLVLVATKELDGNLATLCEAVYKKRGASLTPEERTAQNELRQRNDKALASIQTRQSMAVAYRGRISAESLARVTAEMEERGVGDALLVEPPGDDRPSTLALFVSKSEVAPRLAIRIPLRSADVAPAGMP
ncbi:MAG TPA: DUF4384 domain-containing protein [Pirellulales bacterium]|nr:DUF4384 domain-containing protein [Pirellulales bacterium]